MIDPRYLDDDDFELDLIRDPMPSTQVPGTLRTMRARRVRVDMPTGPPSVQEVLHNPAGSCGSRPTNNPNRATTRASNSDWPLVSWRGSSGWSSSLTCVSFQPRARQRTLLGVPLEWLFPRSWLFQLLMLLGWFYIRRPPPTKTRLVQQLTDQSGSVVTGMPSVIGAISLVCDDHHQCPRFTPQSHHPRLLCWLRRVPPWMDHQPRRRIPFGRQFPRCGRTDHGRLGPTDYGSQSGTLRGFYPSWFVAAPLRRSGAYTIPDLMSLRLPSQHPAPVDRHAGGIYRLALHHPRLRCRNRPIGHHRAARLAGPSDYNSGRAAHRGLRRHAFRDHRPGAVLVRSQPCWCPACLFCCRLVWGQNSSQIWPTI